LDNNVEYQKDNGARLGGPFCKGDSCSSLILASANC